MHSTESALLKVTSDLLTGGSKGCSVFVLLDLTAAFDTVDYTVLLERLKHCEGIKGIALQCFPSYLFNRTVLVNTDGS